MNEPLLAESFLTRFSKESGRNIRGFTDECVHVLQRYDWPGNVRELENSVERAVVLCKGQYITPEDLPSRIIAEPSLEAEELPEHYLPVSLKEALALPEKKIIERALRANNWNRQQTASQLCINRTTLYKKMKRYGLDRIPEAVISH